MIPIPENLLHSNAAPTADEQFRTLLQTSSFRLEHIVSHGAASPDGFWYDQSENEWVLLAQGDAVLEFERDEKVLLTAGDYLLIPAHRKHRVESCSADAVWLALHFDDA